MEQRILSGIIVEESQNISLQELCRACNADTGWITSLVHEGILDPADTVAGQWYFSAIALKRVFIVKRLQHDLDINLAGAALVLELLEEREQLLTGTARWLFPHSDS